MNFDPRISEEDTGTLFGLFLRLVSVTILLNCFMLCELWDHKIFQGPGAPCLWDVGEFRMQEPNQTKMTAESSLTAVAEPPERACFLTLCQGWSRLSKAAQVRCCPDIAFSPCFWADTVVMLIEYMFVSLKAKHELHYVLEKRKGSTKRKNISGLLFYFFSCAVPWVNNCIQTFSMDMGF